MPRRPHLPLLPPLHRIQSTPILTPDPTSHSIRRLVPVVVVVVVVVLTLPSPQIPINSKKTPHSFTIHPTTHTLRRHPLSPPPSTLLPQNNARLPPPRPRQIRPTSHSLRRTARAHEPVPAPGLRRPMAPQHGRRARHVRRRGRDEVAEG